MIIGQYIVKIYLCVVLAISFVQLIIRARYLIHSFLAAGSEFLFSSRAIGSSKNLRGTVMQG